MRKLATIALLAGITAFTSLAALGCGDKLSIAGLTVRYRQVNAGAHPASILAYARQDSAFSGVLSDIQSQKAVKQIGHKFHAVEDSGQLIEALKTGKYDVLMADASDAEALQIQIQSAPSKPALLPVVYKSTTKAEANAIEKRFRCVLKAPGSPNNYIAAIDDAMALKLSSH